jgi:hypothetical protein
MQQAREDITQQLIAWAQEALGEVSESGTWEVSRAIDLRWQRSVGSGELEGRVQGRATVRFGSDGAMSVSAQIGGAVSWRAPLSPVGRVAGFVRDLGLPLRTEVGPTAVVQLEAAGRVTFSVRPGEQTPFTGTMDLTGSLRGGIDIGLGAEGTSADGQPGAAVRAGVGLIGQAGIHWRYGATGGPEDRYSLSAYGQLEWQYSLGAARVSGRHRVSLQLGEGHGLLLNGPDAVPVYQAQ